MSLPPLPEPYSYPRGDYFFNAEQTKAYGQACRAAALEEAAQAIEDANARRVVYLPDAIEIIRSLK